MLSTISTNFLDNFSPRTSLSYAISEDRKWKWNTSIGKYYKINDGPNGATEYFQPNVAGKILTPIQAERVLTRRGYRRRRTTIEELELPTKYVKKDKRIRQMEPGGDSLVGAAEHFSSMNPSDPYPSEFAFFMEDIV